MSRQGSRPARARTTRVRTPQIRCLARLTMSRGKPNRLAQGVSVKESGAEPTPPSDRPEASQRAYAASHDVRVAPRGESSSATASRLCLRLCSGKYEGPGGDAGASVKTAGRLQTCSDLRQ